MQHIFDMLGKDKVWIVQTPSNIQQNALFVDFILLTYDPLLILLSPFPTFLFLEFETRKTATIVHQ